MPTRKHITFRTPTLRRKPWPGEPATFGIPLRRYGRSWVCGVALKEMFGIGENAKLRCQLEFSTHDRFSSTAVYLTKREFPSGNSRVKYAKTWNAALSHMDVVLYNAMSDFLLAKVGEKMRKDRPRRFFVRVIHIR